MGRINQLKPEVFNMIAAGEVVERPSSVVKELVENSIDAGARTIDIEIEEGGIRKISVSDDGIGVLPDDMRAAFLPHATSKLKSIDDLDVMSTLGFRGEALASIASVSEVTMTSCPSDGEAAQIVLKGGVVTFEGATSRSNGTTICVENLFYNTPARIKFLKKASSEARAVEDTVRQIMLANSDIALSLTIDGEIVLQQQSGTIEDSLYSVYDTKTADGLMFFDADIGDIRVYGYTSKLDYTKSNRTWQTIIVNGRCVESQIVSAAVEKAYSGFLMKRCYPMFVLNMLIPFDELDVNVHPRKAEVRFSDNQRVFGAVYRAISTQINEYVKSSRLGFVTDTDAKNVAENASQAEYGAQMRLDTTHMFTPQIQRQNPDYVPNTTIFEKNADFHIKTSTSVFETEQAYPYDKNIEAEPVGNYSQNAIHKVCVNGVAQNADFENNDQNFDKTIDSTAPNQSEKPIVSNGNSVFDGKIIGQVFDTFIIVERDQKVYLIDQHAAHERILYDKLMKTLERDKLQYLLVPLKIKLDSAEAEYLEQIYPKLNDMGFDIQQTKSDTFIFHALPVLLADMDIKTFLGKLFENMVDGDKLDIDSIVRDKVCQQACKAAIKAGYAFSREQIEQILNSFLDEDGNLPSSCPHGRPAVVALTKKDLEKLFKRIV